MSRRRRNSDKQLYQILIVSGAGEANGIYCYSYQMPQVGHAYYNYYNKINFELNKIMKSEILYEKKDDEWECVKGKAPAPTQVELITINNAFLKTNLQKKHQLKPLYDKYDKEKVETIQDNIKHQFIFEILISMLFCSHYSLSVMFIHQEYNNSDLGWLAIICEECDKKWKEGIRNQLLQNKLERIHIKYEKEHCGKGRSYYDARTSPYHSLEKKRKLQKLKTSQND